MKRLALAVAGLALLAMLAGCAGLGGSSISQEQLAQNATYDWNTSENVTVTASSDEYQAVHQVENQSSLALSSRGTLGGAQPLSISAVKFRYPNGTIVGSEAISVSTSNSETVIEFPAEYGQFAYTASSGPRSLRVPVVTEGSHEVVLPPGMRVEVPVFGAVDPGGYEKTLRDNRVHLSWESIDRDAITVQYYLERDLYIFGGLVGLLGLVAIGGVVYFRLQIRQLERRREESGLELEQERN